MNKYTASGDGFRGDNEFLMFIQSIIQEVAQLSSIGGENYIVKGCVDTAGTVSPGWMVLNGEIVEFLGGAFGAQVTVIETVENVTYIEDINPVDGQGDSKPAYFTRKAQFGNSGVYTINWASLRRINPLIDVQKAITPVGGIIMWAGSVGAIPQYWALCDGANGTPNLKGKFIVGYDSADADYNAIGDQGGAKTVVLTESQIPAHNHSGNTASGGGHTHTGTAAGPYTGTDIGGGFDGGGNAFKNRPIILNSGGAHSHSLTTNNTGGGAAHENRPPYYTLAYIQYKGV